MLDSRSAAMVAARFRLAQILCAGVTSCGRDDAPLTDGRSADERLPDAGTQDVEAPDVFSEGPCASGPPTQAAPWQFEAINVPSTLVGGEAAVGDRLLLATDDGVWSGTPRDTTVHAWNWSLAIPDLRGGQVAHQGNLVAVIAFDGITYGTFVYVSADLASTWTLAHREAYDGFVSALLLSSVSAAPVGQQVIMMGGRYAPGVEGVLISRDLGATWDVRAWGLSEDRVLPWSIAQSPVTGTLIVATELADHPPPYPSDEWPPLLRSVDGGETWENVHPPGMYHGLEGGVLSRRGAGILPGGVMAPMVVGR